MPRARPDGILGVAPMVWRYSSDAENPREPMRFGRRLTEQIGSNVVVLTNSTAVAIRTRPDGPTVEHVEFADRDGRRACDRKGGSPLRRGHRECSPHAGLQGGQRSRGPVPHGPSPRVESHDSTPEKPLHFWHPSAGREGARLCGCAGSGWTLASSATSACSTARAGLRRSSRRTIRLRHSGGSIDATALIPRRTSAPWRGTSLLAGSMVRHATGRGRVQHRYSEVTLTAMCEQKPDQESRVMLADRMDRFGVPLSRIDWHVSTDEARTLRRMAHWWPPTSRTRASSRPFRNPGCGTGDAAADVHRYRSPHRHDAHGAKQRPGSRGRELRSALGRRALRRGQFNIPHGRPRQSDPDDRCARHSSC